MFELITAVAVVAIASALAFFTYLLLKGTLRRVEAKFIEQVTKPELIDGLADSLLEKFDSFANQGDKGGIVSAANRQANIMLSTILERVIEQGNPLLSFAIQAVPEIRDWVKDKSYGVLALIANPMVQRALPGLLQSVGQAVKGGNGEKPATPGW